MDDLTIVVKWGDRIEWLLKQHYHAKGSDLEELIDSCEDRLPDDMYDKLKYIAAIKSEALQQDGYKIANVARFLVVCKKCEQQLLPRSAKMIWRFVLFLIFAVTAGAIWFYAVNWSYITDF